LMYLWFHDSSTNPDMIGILCLTRTPFSCEVHCP
jgi:hypothetical protein